MMLSLACLTVMGRTTQFAAVMHVELRRVEPGQANIGIVGELAKNDPAAEVVHVDPNEVQAAAELIGQREHEGYVVRKPRVRWRVRTAATERQAGPAASSIS